MTAEGCQFYGLSVTPHLSLLHPFPALAVAALNLPEISREVGAAVQRVVSEQSAGLRSSLAAPSAAAGDGRAAAPAADPAAEAATLARQLAPAITSEAAAGHPVP